ncbi:MAG TPA: S41 family peptidase [Ignavibacteriaceae bacterium]|nr:S41 family peptidase [Ignavibacteriaceae bacterium]
MKKLTLLLFFVCFSGLLLAKEEARFMRYPDIYKNKIVFTYEGDLWLADADGTDAKRVTTFPGDEFSARFSPDGQWIAFTGEYDGGSNVYVMSSDGGVPLRITYNPGGAQSIGWTPDGKRVIFRSYWQNVNGRDPDLYFVDKNGSAPERFPIDRGRLCSFSPDGNKIVYQRKGDEEYQRKRYKGGQYPDIWMYDFTTNKFTAISDYVGKNAYPMWIGENTMYFVSDRTNGVSNLYKEDLSSKNISEITNYSDVDVINPETDGEQIIFMHDGYINLLNLNTNEITKITVDVSSDRWALRDRNINPKNYIHYMDISNDGKTAVFGARGDVYTVPTGEGKTENLSWTPGSRELYPAISPDGKWVAFFSDKSGEYELYIQKSSGGEWTQMTNGLKHFVYHMVWSPDGKKILFGNKDFKIFYVVIASKKLVQVDESNQLKNDEFYWEESDYNWSPDSKWICYSFTQYNKNNQVFIYNIDENKKYAVTDDFFDNINPRFDANGKYLYFLSSRNFDLHMDFYEDNHVEATPQQVMVVQLQDGLTPPFAEPVSSETKKASDIFRIDTKDLIKRTYPLPVDAGNYFFLKAGNGKVAWSSVPAFTEDEYEEIFKPGRNTKWDLHIFDMTQKKEVVLSEKIRDFSFSTNGENLIINRNKDYFTSSVNDAFKSESLGSKVNLDNMNYLVDNQKEWNQIFNDTWRWYRDFFYDSNMVGVDWKAIGGKYRAYIPYLSSRGDLNWVLQQMVGELATSHTYIWGGDYGPVEAPETNVSTGWLGADLVADKNAGYYKFDKIYGPTEYNLDLNGPLSRPDISLNEGDYLIAINGKEIKVPQDYFKELQITHGQKVSVTVNSKPTMNGAKTYEIEPIRNSRTLRYFRWITDNIHKVLKETGGKVGYMHITAMGAGGIGEFDKYWRAFRYKDGLIIDVRRNSGGWTEYFMIDKLERKMTAYNVLNGMVPFRYPGSTSNGHYIAVTNEDDGSDGEAFLEDFKANGLGKIVGVPTWGGLVGIINGQTTIDNGTVHQSNNGFYGNEGKWLVENHGTDPDIYIDNDPASVMAGKDLQLETAIKEVMKEIKEDPFKFAPQPPYPKR